MTKDFSLEGSIADFRSNYNISPFQPIRIKSLLQQLNVLTVFRQMSNSFSGMAVKSKGMKFMLINSNHSVGRQHFTILHELFHIEVQKDFNSIVCGKKMTQHEKRTEEKADNFAAELLIPEEGLFKIIPDNERVKDKISVESLFRIEHFFSCSRSALLRRLTNLGLLSNQKSESLKNNVLIDCKLLGFDNTLYNPGNHNLIVGDYGITAKKLYDANKISYSHFVNLMLDLGIDIEEPIGNFNE